MVGGVTMGDGVQYMRTLEGGATLQTTPQIISVPIALPGAKPGMYYPYLFAYFEGSLSECLYL